VPDCLLKQKVGISLPFREQGRPIREVRSHRRRLPAVDDELERVPQLDVTTRGRGESCAPGKDLTGIICRDFEENFVALAHAVEKVGNPFALFRVRDHCGVFELLGLKEVEPQLAAQRERFGTFKSRPSVALPAFHQFEDVDVERVAGRDQWAESDHPTQASTMKITVRTHQLGDGMTLRVGDGTSFNRLDHWVASVGTDFPALL
jgi:hypothetical protein